MPITLTHEALPFQTIAMDFIVKLPESEGFDLILTITDHDCTKMLITIPCRETINAEGVVELFLRQIFPRFGLPSKIISNWDPRFISRFMKELCWLLGITQNISTAYHPWTDGQSEQSNQWLEQYLCFWVDHQQINWHHYLSLAEFTHNSWKNETMGQTPFETLMGYTPRAEIFNVASSIHTMALCLRDWKKAREEAQWLMIKAQKKWAQRRTLEWTFKIGDWVWLKGRNLHLDCPLIKLSPKRHGPFKIKKVLSPITYQLDLPTQWNIHDIFNIDLLTPLSRDRLSWTQLCTTPSWSDWWRRGVQNREDLRFKMTWKRAQSPILGSMERDTLNLTISGSAGMSRAWRLLSTWHEQGQRFCGGKGSVRKGSVVQMRVQSSN